MGQATKKIKIKGNYQDRSLDLVLLDLEINYRLSFEYPESLVKGKRITAVFPKTNVENGLALILLGTGLTFEQLGPRKIAIKAAEAGKTIAQAAAKPSRQNFTIKGVIKDQNTGETLPFANIMVNGSTNGTTSNIDGFFTLFEVPDDTTVLDISYIGYRP